MMSDYNFYVVAELRDDLSTEDKEKAWATIKENKERYGIINLDDISYRQAPPVVDIQDLSSIGFFYCELELSLCGKEGLLKRLELYDVKEGLKKSAV